MAELPTAEEGGEGPADQQTPHVLEELRATLETLRLSEGRLRQQNEALAARCSALEAEQRAAGSEAMFRALLEAAPDSIIIVDRNGRIVLVNRQAERMFGYQRDELIGQLHEALVPERFRAAHAAHRASYHSTPQTRPMGMGRDLLARRKDGSEFPVEISLSPLETAEGLLVTTILRDVTDRRRVEEAARFLAHATALLTALLDDPTRLQRLAQLAIPYLADYCRVDLVGEDGALRQAAVASVVPQKEERLRGLRHCSPLDPDRWYGGASVLRTGKSELVPTVDARRPVTDAGNATLQEVMRELGAESYMVVPLLARGRALGTISLAVAGSGRHYAAADLALVEDLASRAALAIDNARLYQQYGEIARTLQQSLLPPELPHIPGIDLGATYRAIGEGIEVGGDFYDLFELPGRAWAIMMGDVSGRGPAAAAVTAQARYTARALAMRERRPDRILSLLNQALLQQRDDGAFCTAVFARLEPGRSGARLTLSGAGHPYPLLLRRDGRVEAIGEPCLFLGVQPDVKYISHVVDLKPDDALVFYTDGVTEARTSGELFGEERLAKLVGSCVGLDAKSIVRSIEQQVMEFQGGDPRDDMAILALRVHQ